MTTSASTKQGSGGLVLSGGGARAAYEVGVLKALLTGRSPATNHAPLDFNFVAGTSAGSLNACLLLSAMKDGASAAARYIEDVWLGDLAQLPGNCNNRMFRLRASPIHFLNPSCWLPNPLASLSELAQDAVFLTRQAYTRGANLFFANEQFSQKIVDLIDFSSLVSTGPFETILSSRIDMASIRLSPVVLTISCTDWRAGVAKVFTNTSMTDEIGVRIILASSAIPGIFPAVEIENNLYVDGGVVMNTPLKPVIDSGAEVLHVIYTEPAVASTPLPRLPSTASAILRALEMTLGSMLKKDIELAAKVNLQVATGRDKHLQSKSPHRQVIIHRYSSNEAQDVGWLSFGLDGLKQLIDLGFRDAVAHNCKESECVLPTQNSDGLL
ncbi:MAG TPA: patatin-like phospholipase family protein [Candidatus Angelobacter sp.]|jgi:NTE family protein|nr:patatin-like phospholipase family protein [Candidatus Angelobacter sp.]